MIEEGLKIKIGGDIVEVTKSIAELEKEFKDLSQTLKTQTGQAFVDTNKKLERLSETIKQVRNVGRTGFNEFGESIEKGGAAIARAGQAAQGAVPALNSVSQVARDLPFGFIAIQNNLPIVVDQFGALIKTSGGVGGALKGLGAALIGPAGVAFAFGAITAVVTGLVQKYGSLGAAIDNLIKGNDKLFKQQQLLNEVSKEANKNAGEEIARYKFLEQTIANSTLPLQVRKDAIKDIKEEYGAYLQNMSDEDLLNGKLAASTELVVKALQNKALAQAAVAKASTLSTQSLDILEQEEKKTAQITALQARQAKERGKFRTTQGGTQDIAAETQKTIDAITRERDALRKSRLEIDAQIESLFKRAQASTAAAGAGAIDARTQAEKEEEARKKREAADRARDAALRKQQQQEKDLLAARIKGYEIEKQKIEQNAGQLTDAYLQVQKNIAITKAKLDLVGEVNPETIKQIRENLTSAISNITSEFNRNRQIAGKIEFVPILELDREEAAKRWQALYQSIRETGLEEATKTQGKVSGKISILPSATVQENITGLDKMKEKVRELSSNFSDFLSPAIDAAFGALEQGQNIIQAIGASFKRLIVQIGATIVKAAILAAIISSLGLGPGAGVASGGFGKIFTGLLGIGNTAAPGLGGVGAGAGVSFGNIAPPAFNAPGAAPIQVQISGQFIQRGPDLVASINNTNATIGRVG
jgi:hypothetical protein